jgi:2-polyprenyl-6-methoxyphenol hydroxylase-like FAD-dependent oxidoreductase
MKRLIGSHESYDAIVVGARAAGAATAMLLGRAGRRVLLVDRSEYGADTLSTHALLRSGVLQLHRWGLLDDVRRAGTPPVTATRFHYGDDVIDVAIRPDNGVDALYAPRRTVLDPILVDAARDAGVEVTYKVRVTDVVRDSDGHVHGIRAQTLHGDDAIATAPIVIGADGIHSTIARLVGAQTVHETTTASAFIYGYFDGFQPGAYDWYFRPGVSAGVIPTNDGLANVFVGLPPARFSAEARGGDVDAAFRAVLREAAPDVADRLAGRAPVARHRSFPGQVGHLRRAHGPGWALVGDAGSYKDPLTAHGITAALRDAELLVRSLVTTSDAVQFETTRDAFAAPLLDVTASLSAYDWDLPEVMNLHNQLKGIIKREVDMLTLFDALDASEAA